MKGLFLSLLFTVSVFISSSYSQQTIDLSGKWKFRKAGTQQWFDATVPGCVHTDLMNNKLINDPYYRDNEKDVQWVGEIGWEYMKEFEISDTLFRKRHVELVLQGLDTYANVFLNDSLVVVADNMFKEWYADIRYTLKIGRNVLKIQFPSVKEMNNTRYQKLPNTLPGDERVVARKAAYHFGWDWGPVLITSGIWKPVYLRTWNYNRILGVQYIQRSLTDSAANMTAVFTVISGLGDTATLLVKNGKEVLAEVRAGIKKGVNVVRADFVIRNPQKWWCNGLGDHPLYTLNHEIIFAGRKEDAGSTRIGLRTLELVQDRDSIGQGFYFRLNGVPVFMKGANYIPQDNLLSRVKDDDYKRIISDAAEANMNMLRVWGGGTYEKDIFYDLCDEKGILVWQDFMFANAMYPDDKEFLGNIQGEAVQNVVRLRHHPCIALWCGNNEILEGWRNWGWTTSYGYNTQDSIRIWNNYRNIFLGMLAQQVIKFDTLRPYISTSPSFGWGKEQSYRIGDSHYWGVWWGKEPFSRFNEKTGRFVSEYGFQGFPSMETIKKFTLPDDRKPGSAVMKAHQKHPEGYQIIDEYMNRDFNKPKDFESYVYVSQLLQAEGYKTAIEAHRRAKPYCMGTLYWQFNDCWPVVSWSSIDYYGNKKAVYYTVKNEYKTVLVAPFEEKGKIRIYVNSDSLKDMKADLKLQLMDFSGKILFDTVAAVNIPANSCKVYTEIDKAMATSLVSPANALLSAKIVSGTRIIAENIFYFTAPKDMDLGFPEISKTVKSINDGYEITLKSNILAKGVFVSSSSKGELNDNYFDLIPGEERTIFFKTSAKDPAFEKSLKIISLRNTW